MTHALARPDGLSLACSSALVGAVVLPPVHGFGSAFYADKTGRPMGKVTVPTASTMFPADLVIAPREFAERYFDVPHWEELSAGGHFAAWERPQDYVRGVRPAVDLVAPH